MHVYKKFRPKQEPEFAPVEVPPRFARQIKPVQLKPLPRIKIRQNRSPAQHLARIVPIVLVVIGSTLIVNIIWPIISYQMFESKQLQSPVQHSRSQVAGASTDTPTDSMPAFGGYPAPKVLAEQLDFTDLSQWFPNQVIPEVTVDEAKVYSIDIPSLNIEQVNVKVGGLNLDKNLIQYPGTSNPGELGGPVIFGHSVSPLFYNPSLSNPRRYTSIFTKIMSLKEGAQIIVHYDGVTYTYVVTQKTEVKPEDTYILEQQYDKRVLKLVTCVPPGTYSRRGVITAELQDIQ